MVSNYGHYYWLIYRGCSQPCCSSLTQFCFQGNIHCWSLLFPNHFFHMAEWVSLIALEWFIQHFVITTWIFLGKSYRSSLGHSILPDEYIETTTSHPPIALISSPALRSVYNIFSTSELNVIVFITIVNAFVVQVQKYPCLCYSWIFPYGPTVSD